jgi:hypothetical protein
MGLMAAWGDGVCVCVLMDSRDVWEVGGRIGVGIEDTVRKEGTILAERSEGAIFFDISSLADRLIEAE